MRFLPLFILFFILSFSEAFATHNRAGEITFKHLTGFTYEVLVTTYTKNTGRAINADRCELEIDFGDGTMDTINRTNGLQPSSNLCSHRHVGVPIFGKEIKINEYRTVHSFPGPFFYTISVEDPNRNADIRNIDGSVSVPFYLESQILVSGINNSPELQNLPIDEGCVQKRYEYNPGAVDSDGDSLVYSLVACRGAGGLVIPQYQFPNEVNPGTNNQISINTQTGTVTWQAPQTIGEYNICILIEEYRKDQFGVPVLVGNVLRDMQITIGVCENDPPVIEKLEELCVVAGEQLVIPIVASDPNGDVVILTATGEPLGLENSPAKFEMPTTGDSVVTRDFEWQTTCDHVRDQPYQVVFKAQDFGHSVDLVDYEVLRIRVIAPAPDNPIAEPQGNNIIVSWDKSICNNAIGYRIYRLQDSLGYEPDSCVTGVPAFTGYGLIGTNDGLNNISFMDDNGGAGLIHGQLYCYMIVAYFADGAESYPTTEVCTELKKDVPVLVRVSVNTTDETNGSDTIRWTKPTELDTDTQFPGPYHYRIYQSVGNTGNLKLVGQTNEDADLENVDTVFVDTLINTLDDQHYYLIELHSRVPGAAEPVLTGSSHNASSVYLSSIPSDNTLSLFWTEDVPWTNREYEVYKFNQVSGDFELLATVTEPAYEDTDLTNLRSYLYFVRSIGGYSAPGFINPILNNSQIHTGIPIDLEAPCPPVNPFIESDCDINENSLTWGNPNNYCEDVDDVIGYNLYFTPVLGGELRQIASYDSLTLDDTIFTQVKEKSIAGCYAITAVDSFLNESKFSDPLCVDNCPIYELPNVFTPGGDGVNDFFRPFPYKFVESIELEVYNRWGQKVFETTEPDIQWDGTDMNNKQHLESGVYFYVCTVNEIRLVGIVPRVLKGYVHILQQKDFRPSGN